MKQLIGIILIGGIATSLSAGVRTPADALRIANEFVKTAHPKMHRTLGIQPSIADSTSVYFAVNTASGYVLVGADERLPEVLGYSDNGAFEPDNISPAFRYWMQCYEEEAMRNQEVGVRKQASGISAVAPLCASIWNQSTPFNKYAPEYNDSGSKCVTGCVATAMAQIMYFHKHPAQGSGSYSYYWICTEPVGKAAWLSADFGNTSYDWGNMIDNYRSGYTNEQADAVATLMYHCGVSINMGYGSSSGAYTTDVPRALKNYFDYDANYQRIQKVMYSPDSLNAIIFSELKANRPVLVSGSNEEGGHAFVCDGCDSKGYFHINWGWGGSNDGYFLLTALNPRGSQGIGGTTQGYNKGTAFIIGIQPAGSSTPYPIPQMATTNFTLNKESFNRSESFNDSILRLENFGLTDFNGSYGVALYDEDETQLVAVLKQVDNYSLEVGYHRTTIATITDIKIPNTVPDGNYHLCVVYKDAHCDWMRMMCTQDDYFRTLSIVGSQVTFYPNDAAPEITLSEPIAFPEGTDLDSIPFNGLPLSFAIQNTGGTFRGEISARIYKGNFSKGQYEIMTDVVIRRNQNLQSALQQTFDTNLLPETTYKMKLCYRADDKDSWHNFTPDADAVIEFQLYKTPEPTPPTPTGLEELDAMNQDSDKRILLMQIGSYKLYKIVK